MNWSLRTARLDDGPALEALIPLSVRGLQAAHYSAVQMEAALGPVFGLDRQLILDGTYFVAESAGTIVGCGGWSRRRSRYGGDHARTEPDLELEPGRDAARIRAFFVHPAWARRGMGLGLLRACERGLVAAGFREVEITATLAGEPLYLSGGYTVTGRHEIPLSGGLSLPAVQLHKSLALTLTQGTPADLGPLVALKDACIARMRAEGIEQWDEIYPAAGNLSVDLAAERLRVLRLGSNPAGTVTIDRQMDPLWTGLDWREIGGPVAAVHRLMIAPAWQGCGLGRRLMDHAEELARLDGCTSIRLDAFAWNPAALALYDRLGYRRTGTAMMRKGPFIGFEKRL